MGENAVPEYLTTAEVAELLRKPKSWVHNRAGELGIPRIRLGNHYRYVRTEVVSWANEQREAV